MTDFKTLARRYQDSCLIFRADSDSWGDLDPRHFYTTHETEAWHESSDNENGGISVAWAFREKAADIIANASREFEEEVRILVGILATDIADERPDLDEATANRVAREHALEWIDKHMM